MLDSQRGEHVEKYIDRFVDNGVSVEQVNHSYFSDFLDNKRCLLWVYGWGKRV